MSIKVTLIDGTVIEKEDYDYDMVVPRLLKVGCKLWKLHDNTLIVADKIAYVEDTTDYDEVQEETEAAILAERAEAEAGLSVGQESAPESEPEVEREDKVEPKKKSAQEKNDEALAWMKEMSECTHEEHEIYFTETTRVHPKTKKKSVSKRYFPVCAKCGLREKFVKADSLPDEVKENAMVWDR